MAILQDIKVSYKPLGGFIAIGLAWSAFFAQMPVVKAGTGASDGAFGLAMLWASVGAVAAMWMAPWAYQRAGRFAVPLSICVIAAGLVGAGMVGTLWALAIMLFLISIGTGVVDVLINAQVAEIEARTGRKLMSLNHSLYSFAYAAAAFGVGGFRTAGWTPVQIFWVCFVILGVLAFTTIGRRVAVSAQSEGPTPNAGLPIALVLAAGALVFFAFLTESSTEGWSALYIERELHGSAQQGAMGPAMLGLMMGIGRLSGHVLTRAMSEIRLMVLGALLAGGGLAGVALAQTVVAALVCFALVGLGVSVLAPLTMALVGRAVPQAMRLAVIARVSVLGYGAFFCGPPLVGLIAEGVSLNVAFLVIGGVIGLTAVTLVPLVARLSVLR